VPHRLLCTSFYPSMPLAYIHHIGVYSPIVVNNCRTPKRRLSPGFPQAADIDTRPEFYKHIVLSGGSTMYAVQATSLRSRPPRN